MYRWLIGFGLLATAGAAWGISVSAIEDLLAARRYEEALAAVQEEMRAGPPIAKLRELRALRRRAEFGVAMQTDGVEALAAFIERYESGADVLDARRSWCERMETTARAGLDAGSDGAANGFLAGGRECGSPYTAFEDHYVEWALGRGKAAGDGEALVALADRFSWRRDSGEVRSVGADLILARVDTADVAGLLAVATRFPDQPAGARAAALADEASYVKVGGSSDPEDLARYLSAFPEGAHVETALARYRQLLQGRFVEEGLLWRPIDEGAPAGGAVWFKDGETRGPFHLEARSRAGELVPWGEHLPRLARRHGLADDALVRPELAARTDPSGAVRVEVPCLSALPPWASEVHVVPRSGDPVRVVLDGACERPLDRGLARSADAAGRIPAVVEALLQTGIPGFAGLSSEPVPTAGAGEPILAAMRSSEMAPPGSAACPMRLAASPATVPAGLEVAVFSSRTRVGTFRFEPNPQVPSGSADCRWSGWLGSLATVNPPPPRELLVGALFWGIRADLLVPAAPPAAVAAARAMSGAADPVAAGRELTGLAGAVAEWHDLDGDGAAELCLTSPQGSAVVRFRDGPPFFQRLSWMITGVVGPVERRLVAVEADLGREWVGLLDPQTFAPSASVNLRGP